ncbi:Iron-sulfur assembly protein 2 [Grifola frondosa]|uniref:Iron-sulfur assembly protein 2 n=1 Tax=Grifola frondosa TaxID=5627 RepID=A0A1C7LMP8_GRIFR|nr:Iron-sulfur assembly protein 2 [Grifola frondosa]
MGSETHILIYTCSARCISITPTSRSHCLTLIPISVCHTRGHGGRGGRRVLPPEEARIEVTERAAEVLLYQQLRAIAKREDNPDAALRVAVESGGCHGYQYKMELAKSRESDDYHFTHPRITPANIYVDAVSMGLLNGSTIDFATELIGSSFRILDNPHAKGSGCGCGVSWELKV